MKRYLDLTQAEAEALAVAEGREVEFFPESEDEGAFLRISTALGNGCDLILEDGMVVEYAFCDWL